MKFHKTFLYSRCANGFYDTINSLFPYIFYMNFENFIFLAQACKSTSPYQKIMETLE